MMPSLMIDYCYDVAGLLTYRAWRGGSDQSKKSRRE